MIKLAKKENKCATIKLVGGMFDVNVDVDVDVDEEVEVEAEEVVSFAGAAVLSVVFVPAIVYLQVVWSYEFTEFTLLLF